MIQKGDICKLRGKDLEPVDVIIGGSPCQNISISGNGRGLDGDESRLFFEQMRVVVESREASGLPRFMVWENVFNIFACNMGCDFRSVLAETVKVADRTAGIAFLAGGVPKSGWERAGALIGENWSVAWRLTNAKYYGVPQSRKRIAVVADFDGTTAPDILFGTKPLKDKEKPVRPVMFRRFTGKEWEDAPDEMRRHSDYGDGPEVPDVVILKEILDPYAEPECYLTVKACEGIFKRAEKRHKVISPNLEAGMNGNIAFDPRRKGLPEGHPSVVETLHHNGFGDYRISDFSSALKASGGDVGYGSECLVVMKFEKEGKDPVYLARHLSLTECERIQGFPPGWTDIGTVDAETGEKFFIDTNGKRRNVTVGARGKAIGNSIAIPFWQKLAENICSQYERRVTMGSLFDGISGFCYIFAKIGAEPVWSSEIEEYPVAVCRQHFGNKELGVSGDIDEYL